MSKAGIKYLMTTLLLQHFNRDKIMFRKFLKYRAVLEREGQIWTDGRPH